MSLKQNIKCALVAFSWISLNGVGVEATGSSGARPFKPMQPLESEEEYCGICLDQTPKNKMVLSQKTINQINKIAETNAQKVCVNCRDRFRLFGNTKIEKNLHKVAVSIEKVKNGDFDVNPEQLYEELRRASDSLNWRIKKQLRVLKDLTEHYNKINSKTNELKSIYVQKLWETYPERRKRADYAISDKWLRRMIYERDGYKCKKCGSRKNPSIDHIKPVALGGSNEPDNLQTLCRSCNSKKGASYVG